MKKASAFFTIILIASQSLFSAEQASQPSVEAKSEELQFVPPAGWRFAEKQKESKSMQLMVVGEGANEFPPSINLCTEQYKGSLKDYLKIVKKINEAHGSSWKDLGVIQTEAGPASLSQIDMKTSWGDIREMHVILSKNDTIYILTTAALKSEFPKFYKDFFQSMKSLKFKSGNQVEKK